MFAVIILGVGMTMAAAVFPVSIWQTRMTMDEGTAASIAKSAVATLESSFSGSSLPGTNGGIQPLEGALRQRVYGNLICSSDPRYAWVPLYRRNGNDAVAQVYVFVLRNRNRPVYQSAVDLPTDPDNVTGAGATLDPSGVTVSLQDGGNDSPDLIRFENDLAGTPARVAEGCFVLLAESAGDQNGHVYRVGTLRDATTNTWELQPGGDLSGPDKNVAAANAYLIGRGYADPAKPDQGYEGPAQDVAFYTAFVTVQ